MTEATFVTTLNIFRKERKNVDKRIAALLSELSNENPLLPDTPFRALQRMLKIHRGVKPVLSLIAKLPFMPPAWSGLLDIFARALDVLDSPEVLNTFKAGKDI